MTDDEILKIAERAWLDSYLHCHVGDERAYTLAFARALLATSASSQANLDTSASDKKEVVNWEELKFAIEERLKGFLYQSLSVVMKEIDAAYQAARLTNMIDKQEAAPHIASVYEDKEGTKYVKFDVEDAEDIPVGTKLYAAVPSLTRAEIEEIAHYVETECKACPGFTTLYIAAEAAVEETLHRLAAPLAQSAEQDRIDALEEALKLALAFIDDADISEGQWHWLDEVRPVAAKKSAPPANPSDKGAEQEHCAQIIDGWQIVYAGTGPVAPVIEKHGLKIGSKLYAAPRPAARSDDDICYFASVHSEDHDEPLYSFDRAGLLAFVASITKEKS